MDARRAHKVNRAADGAEPALVHLPSHLCFWLVSGVMFWLDLWSKHHIFRTMKVNEIDPFIPGIISFQRSLNDGAVFGLFTGYTTVFIIASIFALGLMFYLFAHSTRAQRSLHVALALILAGALGNLYDRAYIKADVVRPKDASSSRPQFIGRLVSGPDDPIIRIGDYPDGANAQSFTRANVTVRQQGVVRDFIKFVPKFPAWVPRFAGWDIWPWVFNIADAALVCGVFLLLIHTWLDRKPNT